ncbi:uncharacterized protein MONBRDRAFT_20335 [Monosiga brevicollis MX1]|uniref:phosphatidylinositol 3-kinase n=1 Tax=Monosiga brevicollis TaxID=81824 RepID=A9UUG5_MONBE|nr:uncharacterized protein MONBRDRAFT_20335 [Monosiga brevicollis MX1]EDQ91095.1 predicted protein [Monosiga brevicollis MX1]|eukprot:XP_001744392.1 hypothetical protein [Monosiga brevicollis MX1]
MKLDRPKKVDELQRILSSPKWQQLHDLPFPMDPSVRIKSINARSARIFKSALQPLGLTLETSMGDYGIIFKNGDDLRQDQLVLQVIQLMDRLLKQENLDLRLVPYKCLAANSEIGMLQRVNAEAVASVLSNDRSIKKYLQKQHPDPKGPLGISRQAMDNYVRSCAGYCVVTYLLGVGDRHLDNLMITSEGHLIHVDYGFILGRDPKPMPPPMKITKEMVDAMGGPDGEETGVFRQHCYMGYLILRKHANLILNLFALMVDSTIQDIAIERDRAVAKVRERFRLELDDEQAIYDFRNQMVSSESALMPRLIENLHGLAQRMRK